jgi:hypothetical protein
LIEGLATVSKDELLRQCLDILPPLYHAASRLPETELDDDDDPEGRELTHEQWAQIFNELLGLLGEDHAYREVFDPTARDVEESLLGSLADDLADIYRDLRDNLNSWAEQGDRSPSHVLWLARFHWLHHWGCHAVDAIRYLHYLCYW